MKEIEFDIKKSPFSKFFSFRYSKIDTQNLWNFSKENNLSFFILSLGALLQGLSSVPKLRKRIIDDKAMEFQSLDVVITIMDKNEIS
ncbi:MAG: hypothetical protein LBV42_01890 [Methanobrevibacter sp.]|jgi:chloramphenicol O-acetyltransferase type A|nr:hypothetical protein [Methanobrevibacter sp.]